MGRRIAIVMMVFMIPAAWAAPLTAHQIMIRNFFASKVKSSKSRLTLILSARDGTIQKRRLVVVSRLQRNRVYSDVVTRFTYPQDILGTEFLELQHPRGRDDMWIYLPALHGVRRIVANERRNSFFGTDFSYDDILPSRVSDFTYKRMGSVTLDMHSCYVIQALARNAHIARDTGYTRKISWIRKDDFIAAKTVFYGPAGHKLKILLTKDVKPAGHGHHWIPFWEKMTHVRSGHSTVLKVDRFRADVDAPRRFFSARTLIRR